MISDDIIKMLLGLFIGSIGLGIAIIRSGIIQKKPNFDVTFLNHEKNTKLMIGKKTEIGFQLINNKEVSLISEINFCFPTNLCDFEIKKNGLIGYKLGICGIDHMAMTFMLKEYRLGTYGEGGSTARFFSFFLTPRELGIFKISAVVDAKVDILTLKFPFNWMPEKNTRIRYQLIVDVVDKI